MKTIKKGYENKQKIIIENYLTNKNKYTKRESMEETDFIICLKKINKDLKNTEKIIVKQKTQHKEIYLFSKYYKNGTKSFSF